MGKIIPFMGNIFIKEGKIVNKQELQAFTNEIKDRSDYSIKEVNNNE